MTESEHIADEIRRAFDGDPWHGPPTSRVLEGISAKGAAQRAIPGTATIWEIILHMKAWTGEVHRRLLGNRPAEPEEGEWPPVPTTSETAWRDAQSALAEAHEALVRDVARFPEERLHTVVGGSDRNRELGTGITYYVMLHGLVQHDVYHTAQIATLKRALASRTSGV